MSIIYSPNEWIKPGLSLLADLEARIESAACEVGTPDMDRRDFNYIYTDSAGNHECVITAETFVNGLYKKEGASVLKEQFSKEHAAARTEARILPTVEGEKIWWRKRPEFLEFEDYWYTRMRIGIWRQENQ